MPHIERACYSFPPLTFAFLARFVGISRSFFEPVHCRLFIYNRSSFLADLSLTWLPLCRLLIFSATHSVWYSLSLSPPHIILTKSYFPLLNCICFWSFIFVPWAPALVAHVTFPFFPNTCFFPWWNSARTSNPGFLSDTYWSCPRTGKRDRDILHLLSIFRKHYLETASTKQLLCALAFLNFHPLMMYYPSPLIPSYFLSMKCICPIYHPSSSALFSWLPLFDLCVSKSQFYSCLHSWSEQELFGFQISFLS